MQTLISFILPGSRYMGWFVLPAYLFVAAQASSLPFRETLDPVVTAVMPAPLAVTVTAGSNGPLCAGATLNLTATVTNGTSPFAFAWSGPAGFSAQVQDPSRTNTILAHAGTYTVTVTDDMGISATATVTVEIEQPATADAGADKVLCTGTPHQLNGSIGGSATSATWTASVMGGSFTPDPQALDAQYNPPANYQGNITLTLTTNDPPGPCPAVSDQMLLTYGIPGALVCNDTVFIAMPQTCSVVVTPDMALQSDVLDDLYTVTLYTPQGQDIGNTITSEYVGILLSMRIEDNCSGNFCITIAIADDNLPPVCVPPANTTVDCQHFDPTLAAYGFATGTDNCCMDTVTVINNRNLFDSLCSRGTILRTFRAFDCGGLSTSCTQRIVVNHVQNFYLKFPDDVLTTTCTPDGNYGEPEFFGVDCELIAVSYTDQVFTVVPDACYKIERTWTVINWCLFNPSIGCILVPNPTPNADPNHPTNLPGPTVSEAGASAPWAPTVVAVTPGADPTDFSMFWNPNAGCYRYTQVVLATLSDNQAPTVTCNSCVNADLAQSQTVTVDIADVLQHTEDDVTPQNLLVTAIRKAGAGSGFPLGPGNAPQTSIEFDCSELGLQQVEVWSQDEAGNSAFCLASVVVSDPLGVCGGQPEYPDLSFCPGESTPALALYGPAQGATYSWLNNNPDIGLEVLGIGDIPAFVATNNTEAPLTAIVQVYTHFGACPSPDPVSFTITVQPAPMAFAPADAMVCQGQNTPAVVLTGSLPGMTFSWTNDNPAIGLPAAGTGDIPAFTAENNTSEPLMAHIEVIGSGISGLQCPNPVPAYFSIVVKPVATVADPGDQSVCPGELSAPISFSGNLSGTTFSWTNDNPAIGLPAFGTGDISAFTAVNNTGAPITATITVTPQLGDLEPPSISCLNGLAASLMPPGMVTLFATDFVAAIQDNVTPSNQVKIAIRKAGSGSGFPLDIYGHPQASVCFGCSEVGVQTVEVWVQDACGNADFCQTVVTILDGNSLCNNDPGNGFCITGKAVTEYGDGVENVAVTVTGPGISQTVQTDNGGNYMFCHLPPGQDYEVCLAKDDDPLNGVKTFDLVLMSRHILGEVLLDSPYKIIAADVNLSETVTTEDLLETRDLILQVTPTLTAPSWQFVPADHVFPNPSNPFSDPFPRGCKTVFVNNNVQNQDFIAIKTADLDGDAEVSNRPATPRPTNSTQMQAVCADCPGEPMVFTITIHPTLTFSVAPASPSCNGATDGSLLVTDLSGGQGPYQYALGNDPFQSSPAFGNLGVGTYTITVRDATGCTAQQQAALPQGPDQPLAIQCPAGLPPLTANASCQAMLGDYTALAMRSGGCDIPLNPIMQSPAPGTLVNPGTVAVALTVSNTAGQSATCVFNVWINGGCGGINPSP